MEQYLSLKRKNPKALLFFRCGDFYELFFDDAVEAGKLLGLTVTSRSRDNDIPMAGVPYHSVDSYLNKLVAMGQRVAIAEQLSNPQTSKGLVERDVVEVVSPGTVTESSMLDERVSTFLLAVAVGKSDRVGLAWADVAGGRLTIQDIDASAFADEVSRIQPAEVLLPESADTLALEAATPLPHTLPYPGFAFSPPHGRQRLCDHLGVVTLEAFDCEDLDLALGAAGALIHYLAASKPGHLKGLTTLERWRRSQTMVIDSAALLALEVVETSRRRERQGSLLHAVDRSATPMGARVLREWLLAPLSHLEAIEERHQVVGELVETSAALASIRDALEQLPDLERLASRLAAGRAQPRDLQALGRGLKQLPALKDLLSSLAAPLTQRCNTELEALPDLCARLERELQDQLPNRIQDGAVISAGVNDRLDALRDLTRNAKSHIASYQQSQREQTGIPTLKVGHNAVFGYYLEVTHARKDNVPESYQRKQTLKNAERYITPQLKALETQLESAHEQASALECELFEALRAEAATFLRPIQTNAVWLARLDALASFASLARERNYVRPQLDHSHTLHIRDGRHPVIEQQNADFVPNDTRLAGDAEPFVAVITGPNMAGKSTYCRQVALIVLLAQAGSFVPASSAHIGLVDRLFCRLGAADEISRGLSTFMVEMVETANILRNSSERSFVVLDEVGRGTSTYDGVSLARAVTEHLASRIGCRTLFATHYHELADIAEDDSRVCNLNVAVKEYNGEVIFLHQIANGCADRSYGLHVARIAGVPQRVIDRAQDVLNQLEKLAHHTAPPPSPAPRQLALFTANDHELALASELRALDVNAITPLDALAWLGRWSQRLAQPNGRTPSNSSS